MLISHETPVSLLPYSWGYNDYCYALVHLLPENEKYRDFYFKSVEYGRRVLLDNSIFELGTAFEPEHFAHWVQKLNPYEYVIPDVLEDSDGTCASLDNFLAKYSNLPGKKIGVVQGKTYQELVDCYKFVAPKVDKVAVSFDYSYYLENWLTTQFYVPGFVFNTETNKWIKYALGRVKLLSDFLREGILSPNKPLHLLGAAVPWEFSLYNKNNLYKYVETIDTSNPIVAGILNKKYNPTYGLHDKWSVKLVDFIDAELNTQQLQDSLYNISIFRSFCK